MWKIFETRQNHKYVWPHTFASISLLPRTEAYLDDSGNSKEFKYYFKLAYVQFLAEEKFCCTGWLE